MISSQKNRTDCFCSSVLIFNRLDYTGYSPG